MPSKESKGTADIVSGSFNIYEYLDSDVKQKSNFFYKMAFKMCTFYVICVNLTTNNQRPIGNH